TAVANGDLERKFTVEAKGEIAALADTINSMIDTLATFADQVTTVAREVGVEGQLGGQASVPGAAGTWKHLTDNVNQLAANLTTQVRAIAEVATAVTKGDLTRMITVEAMGEVAARKDVGNEFRLGEGVVGQAAVEKEKILLTNVPTNYIQVTSGLGEAPPLNILVLPVVFEGQVKGVIELASFARFSAAHQAFLD